MTESVRDYELIGTRKISYDEFSKIPYDGLGHHLIKGVHIITPAPSTKHQEISNNVSFLFNTFIVEKKLGKLYTAPIDVKLSPQDGFQPDLAYIGKEHQKRIGENFIDGSPDLVIEILSPNSENSDFGWKKDLIEKFKVPEYWIIDPFGEIIHQFILKGDKLQLLKKYTKGEVISPELEELDELDIDVKRIFELDD